ncbi:MAG: dihydropteroate synthase [Gammaproteobacteria bacterium]|jgi:dihydropteroate synthase|nr:dihydropteroate synthase [Gammaproteobacteria bacterium]MBT4810660.1 dihydropteroate synthase [Thiotrichales bacterium]MBT3968284.1 dihydropteroate synthase [Gammaproteobacteria bacterium]MBT4081315.1 dihydropteroate synthase [Gammaproteobacteria bacterium]MBT4328785.1 dihydropteroate synthase [Gammaproteobacteria bacterium]
MGILNVTPDSFSDGGAFIAEDAAVAQAMHMVKEGASIIDIGGESTRPGAAAVSVDEELQRVVPVVEAIRKQSDVLISVDTSKPSVMNAAIQAGASIINDVRALQEEGALEAAAQLNVSICLMHMQGQPRTMQHEPHYDDVVEEVVRFLQQRVAACELAGIERSQIWVDPGFGFGKTLEHNLQLLESLDQFQALGIPLLVGVSRKTMIGALLGDLPVEKRVLGSVGAAVVAVARGAKIVRVHDVKQTVQALQGAGLYPFPH